MRTQTDQHGNSLLRNLETLLWRASEVRVFRAILSLFLDTKLKTTLQNVKIISASTASRFFSHDIMDAKLAWERLNAWQFERLYQSHQGRKGRKPEVVLKLDLSCIEKTGKKVPFARVFNGRYGIQLITLHACFGKLSFPISQRIYQGKGSQTVVDLALEMLTQFPPSHWPARVVVLADAGFGSREFLRGTQALGFTRAIVGVRCDRILTNGKKLNDLPRRGQALRLHDVPELLLYASWCDVKREEEKKRFYIVSTFEASGRWLSRRFRCRWLIESFFHRVKHDFGLKEARLRTKDGIRLWVFFSFLTYSLASLERFLTNLPDQAVPTFGEAARQACRCLLPEQLLHALMAECEELSSSLQYRLRLVAV
jgi:hypothetical protein